MWILTSDGEPGPGANEDTAFFLAAGTHNVGRYGGTGNGIELGTDLTISRQHAALQVGALDVHGPLASVPSLQLTDLSRFGTAINGRAIGKGNSAPVSPGDVISFGQRTKFRVSWDQVVLCLPDSDGTAQQQAAALGFFCRSAWDSTCTHLVVGQAPGLSPAAACASAASKPIVHRQWLEACMAAASQPVKQMPPPVQSYVQSVALPPSIAGHLPPTDARHAATPAVHAPLRGLTIVWHAGTEEAQLQQAAALAGGSNVSASDPSLAAAVHNQLLHVVANEAADGIPASQPSITAESLMAAIVDGRAAALQALQIQQKPQPAQAPNGTAARQPKRAAAATLTGPVGKKPRGWRTGGLRKDTTAAEEMEFDVANDRQPPRGDADVETAEKEVVEHTVVVAPIISTPEQPPAPSTAPGGTPNFKRFRKGYSADRRPLVPFAAASFARDVGAAEFLKAEKQLRAQNKAADDLFTAKLKAGKAKAGTKR